MTLLMIKNLQRKRTEREASYVEKKGKDTFIRCYSTKIPVSYNVAPYAN